MAKLSDLVRIDGGENSGSILIQDQRIPVVFSVECMEHIGDVYGADYAVFERDMNKMLTASNGKLRVTKENLKIIRALIYGMVRSGGTECTPDELYSSIPFNQLTAIYSVCMGIFTNQAFQEEDLKKSVKPQDFQTSKRTEKSKKRKKKSPRLF
ncbi:hypothetical protein [Carnobacterium maltaromaticum]|uniref:hypothetical protein n=1 Tax=Carnobacterium maltaromaticum TaxID=2751 RepID=UPI0039AF837E